MKEHSTPSILQRVPVILAVTAASYGLRQRAHAGSPDNATVSRKAASGGKAMVLRDRPHAQALALQD